MAKIMVRYKREELLKSTRICEYCGCEYHPKGFHQRFHSGKCRLAFWESMHPRINLDDAILHVIKPRKRGES